MQRLLAARQVQQAGDLGIARRQLIEIVQCTISRAKYLALLGISEIPDA
mgnify:CR=1 FL=1